MSSLITASIRICNLCQLPTQVDNLAGKTRKRNYCKRCDANRAMAYYKANQDRFRITRRQKKVERLKWYRELKSTMSCLDCHENNSYCLCFHHKNNNKVLCPSDLMSTAVSIEIIDAEIAKCDPLCFNCHTKRHWKPLVELSDNILRSLNSRQLRTYRRKRWYSDTKSTLYCMTCQETHVGCLHFHHRNPAEKSFGIANAIIRGVAIPRIETEMAKCDILCGNCHLKNHYNEHHVAVQTK
jgi:hypothetical protein